MSGPILVTGAGGRFGGVGRAVAQRLLQQGKPVRAMVRTDDARTHELRRLGAEIVIGDLLDLAAVHRAVAGCGAMYFGMSISSDYLAATVNVATVARHHGVSAFVNMSQMTVSQMSITETTPSPQQKLHWLSEQALNWSGLPVIHVRPTVLFEGFLLLLTRDDVRDADQIRLPLGAGKTSPIAVADVAAVITTLLMDFEPHVGRTYHLTGPHSEDMHFFAREYSKALGRTITYVDVPVAPWRERLLSRGIAAHLVDHLVTMAELNRAGRYDRMSGDVQTLTQQAATSVRECVRAHSALFGPSHVSAHA